ncbi:MAG: hypothetical protein A4E65_00862 [Syntrophorhabdus sp. PtaU1.Bin153]|nr:MAG: hypothetical protein A4E65_00862 [Syntrophorhabdus sp. PtaU1.Bin153]
MCRPASAGPFGRFSLYDRLKAVFAGTLFRSLLHCAFYPLGARSSLNFANSSRFWTGLKHAHCPSGRSLSPTVIRGTLRRQQGRAQTCSKARFAKSSSCLKQTTIRHVSVMSGYPKQTVVRRGSSVFCCQAKVPKSNASEWSCWSVKSVFVGIFRHRCSSYENQGLKHILFGQQAVE